MYKYEYQIRMDVGPEMPEEISTHMLHIIQESEVLIKVGDILHFEDFLIRGFITQEDGHHEAFQVTAISRIFKPKIKVVETIVFLIIH